MCGILCEICYVDSPFMKNETQILNRLSHRGPDCTHFLEKTLEDEKTRTYFHGSVLWMQGPQLTPQPIENENGILLFNGDIFDETWNSDISDTQMIKNMLSEKSEGYREDHIIKTIRSLKGPFGLIYFDKSSDNLYFTRDRLGRSTLLFHTDSYQPLSPFSAGNNVRTDYINRITISSVLGRNYGGCLEVPAEFIFCCNLKEKHIQMYTWTDYLGPDILPLENWIRNQTLQQNMPDENFCFTFDINTDFSDSENIKNYIESVSKETTDKLTIMNKLIANSSIRKVVVKLKNLLEESVRIRVRKQPNKCKICLEKHSVEQCKHCTVGILFSGGLDCTILSLLAHKFVPQDQEIDLINVAFNKDGKASYDVPDRLTGRQSYNELVKLCPSRIWKFREVNVSKEELEEFKSSTIADLVYPRITILDESLGSALWFAARGKDSNNSVSSCRVLLLGSGADELFGGYTRHRNAFRRRGWIGLAKEMMLDWKRISIRNLSRDNRVISDHGRQPRMPYLDENFTEYILQLKPWFKCFPSEELGPGIGDKLMLRLVALNLGLSAVVSLPKRALQFGSKIANKKEKGSDISESFKKKDLRSCVDTQN